MSNHLISETYKRDLKTHTRKGVMALLADKASDDGGGIYAAKQALADELCTSKQTVIKTINEFVEEGLLEVVGHRGCATGHTVEYRISIEKLHALPYVEYWQKRMAKRSSSFTGQAVLPVKHADGRGQAALPKPLLNPIPPSETNVSDCPQGQTLSALKAGKAKGTRLPANWSAPSIVDLPERVRAQVGQWPDGAYAAVSDMFTNHWHAERGVRASKLDWGVAFHNWLMAGHSRVMRDAKSGVSFKPVGTAGQPLRREQHPRCREEGSLSASLRTVICNAIGQQTYAHWFEPVALLFDGDRLRVVTGSAFAAGALGEQYGEALDRWGRDVFRGEFLGVVIEIERVSNGQEEERQGSEQGSEGQSIAAAASGHHARGKKQVRA